ncbi:hypothetical protein BGZ60DRAFT_87713 [Tricladium varicosporioides]|nr:hypothetical protein BGZ60DRAFT_87713 [Hymenoscyphus varicosporioides]
MGVIIFAHQSGDIGLAEWLSLFTLSLTPLVAHLIAGAPPPTYLDRSKPKWHEIIGHYNPTSILWRYFAITDRRTRAKCWNSSHLAATNAAFWTTSGWNGSEEMIERSQPYRLREPEGTRIGLSSISAITTLIVTLQGVQALHDLIAGMSGGYSVTISISTVFFPLAIFGLLRLPAALWITNDFIYNDHRTVEQPLLMRSRANSDLVANSSKYEPSINELLGTSTNEAYSQFHPIRSWRGILPRAFFAIAIIGVWLLTLFSFSPWTFLTNHDGVFTGTAFAMSLMYLAMMSVTMVIMGMYLLRRRTTSTIIPCIGSNWYKMYTMFIFASMLVVFVIAALESRRTPCGKYTTFPATNDATLNLCGRSNYLNSLSSTSPFAVAIRLREEGDLLKVVSVNGWCHYDSIGTAKTFFSYPNYSNSTNITTRVL